MLSLSITDIVAVVISFFILLSTRKNIIIAQNNLEALKDHNQKCLEPRCNIRSTGVGQSIKITLMNSGHGLMTIDEIIVKNNERDATYHSLYEIFPNDIKLNYYSVDVVGSDIAVNGYIKLIQIDNVDEERRKIINELLSKYEITINYHGVYNTKISVTKDLKVLFGTTYRKQ